MFIFENMMNTSGEYQDGSAIVKIECTHKELAVLLVLVREHLKTEPLFTEALSVRAQAFVKGSAAILQGNNGSKVEAAALDMMGFLGDREVVSAGRASTATEHNGPASIIQALDTASQFGKVVNPAYIRAQAEATIEYHKRRDNGENPAWHDVKPVGIPQFL